MAKVSKSARIARPAAEVWALIRGFNDLPQWMSGGATSTMEGEGVGAVRTLIGAGRVKERLDAYDEAAREFSYSIVDGTLPVAGYTSTMRVIADGDDACIVEWCGTFEPDGAPEAEVVADIEALYARGLAGIKDALGS
jgi:carbon monoxide dehydrogenase subunit G